MICVRLLAELLIAAALIAIGWKTPYAKRLNAFFPTAAKTTPALSSAEPAPPSGDPTEQPRVSSVVSQTKEAQPSIDAKSATSSGDWMWDPKRPGSLDRPGQSATPTTFTGHIFYTDEQGKRYWLDAQGKHHYQP